MPNDKEQELQDKLAEIQMLTGLNDQEWEARFGNKKGLYGLLTSLEENKINILIHTLTKGLRELQSNQPKSKEG